MPFTSFFDTTLSLHACRALCQLHPRPGVFPSQLYSTPARMASGVSAADRFSHGPHPAAVGRIGRIKRGSRVNWWKAIVAMARSIAASVMSFDADEKVGQASRMSG
jgi:hypothetical protein